jgi:hypothetical protein
MNKKGYFFILDALLALGILVMGVFLLMSTYTRTPEKQQTTNIAEDILDFFAKTKIENFNNPYFGPSGTLVQSGVIEDIQKTLLQQLGEFYYRYLDTGNSYYLDLAKNLIANVTQDLIPFQYKYEFLIEETIIYSKDSLSKKNTEVLFPAKRLSFGTVGKTLDLFGPYKVEVLAWQ